MPRRDGTGPLGQGPASGKGAGACGTDSEKAVCGRGRRKGLGRGLKRSSETTPNKLK